jgi:hypothetical protein
MNAIRQTRSAVRPSFAISNECKIVRLCPLSSGTVLACRWRRQSDGRLTCVWLRVASLPYAPWHEAVTDNNEHRS